MQSFNRRRVSKQTEGRHHHHQHHPSLPSFLPSVSFSCRPWMMGSRKKPAEAEVWRRSPSVPFCLSNKGSKAKQGEARRSKARQIFLRSAFIPSHLIVIFIA